MAALKDAAFYLVGTAGVGVTCKNARKNPFQRRNRKIPRLITSKVLILIQGLCDETNENKMQMVYYLPLKVEDDGKHVGRNHKMNSAISLCINLDRINFE